MKSALRAIVGTAVPSPVALPEGVALVSGRWVPWVGGLFTGAGRAAAAVTMGTTIVVHPDVALTDRLVRHELEHVRQWRADGWRFPIYYAWQYLRHGYHANPYEVAARRAEETS